MIDIAYLEKDDRLNNPRRIIKYVLVYCTSGSIDIVVDEKALNLSAGKVITITSGQVHYIRKNIRAKGFILEFTLDFFCKNDMDIELIFQNGLFCHFAMNEVIAVEKNLMEIQLIEIKNELENKPYQYLTSIHSRIELILVSINRAKLERGDEIWKPDALFLKFLESVRDNFGKNYTLSDFSKMLSTTELKLRELAKIHTGRTAQNVIYGLIASEAKRLLVYEKLPVKAVAYKLGFNDPFYFSNFFKKHTRISPKSYQEKNAL